MIANQAAQQVANLLVQAGVPSPHALDVAQRLLSMANESPAPAQGARSFDATSANNAEFFNKYKRDEENAKDGATGKAGKDGLPGYGGRGVDGRDGMPGIPGEPGTIDWDSIRDLIASMIAEALSAFLTHLLTNVLTCRWFRQKFRECMDSWPSGGQPASAGCSPVCCKGEQYLGGQSICSILRRHRITLNKHDRRLNKIERELRNTTDCE